jgi:transcriptional regulator with XRE-family HTH domain
MEYSHEKFFRHLKILKDKAGIDTWQKFEQEINMLGAVYRWKTGKDAPTPESLLKIARRFQVSLDWLLTGKEPQPGFHEPRAEAIQAGPTISRDARMKIKLQIRTYLDKYKETLSTDAWVELELLLEDYYRDTFELPDDQVIKAYLLLCRRPPAGQDRR